MWKEGEKGKGGLVTKEENYLLTTNLKPRYVVLIF
jgi:hypothetical protein